MNEKENIYKLWDGEGGQWGIPEKNFQNVAQLR